MNEMNPNLISEKDSQAIIEKYKKRTHTLALLNDLTRLRLILLLIVFRKLSLTELSALLGRVKSTTSHHLKKLGDIIRISTKKESGKSDSNIYELVPNFLEKLSVNIEDLKNLQKKENKNLFHYVIQNDMKFFELIINIFDLINQIYKFIDDSSSKEKSNSHIKSQDVYLENRIKYNAWFLTEKGKQSYDRLIKEFNQRMLEIIEQDEKNGENKLRSYLMFNAFIPLEKIIQFDPSSVFKFFSIL
ncbi:MAG: ArsR family transcriptional regulator [Promethearchaeota archaeon]